MSGSELKGHTEVANKDSEKDYRPQSPETSNTGSGDNFINKCVPTHSSIKVSEDVKLQSTEQSNIDKHKNDSLPVHVELTPESSKQTSNPSCIDKQKELGNDTAGKVENSQDKKSSTSKDLIMDKEVLVSESKSETKETSDLPAISDVAYKETEIDDVSEMDLELRWTDDEESPSLSDEAIKQLDQELGLTDTVPLIEIVPKLSKNKDLNTGDQNIDVSRSSAENNQEISITGETVKDQPLVDTLLQIDQEHGIANVNKTEDMDKSVDQDISVEQSNDQDMDNSQFDHNIKTVVKEGVANNADKSIDEAVKELEQLIDQDYDNTSQKSELKAQRKSDTGNIDEVKVKVPSEDNLPMDIVNSSEIGNNVLDKEINIKTSEIALERDVTKEESENIPETTATPAVEDNENMSVPSDHVMEENEPENQAENVDSTSKSNVKVLKEVDNTIKEKTPDNITEKHRDILSENAGSKSTDNHIEIAFPNIKDEHVDMTDEETDNKMSEESNNTNIKVETGKDDEFIACDVTNESLKINTDHRINRPDVMLDIPTQEFDIDDFDETLNKQAETERYNESDVTSKTVTEIVNQLSNDIEINEDDTVITADVKEVEADAKNIDCDPKTSHNKQTQSEENVNKDISLSKAKIISEHSKKIDVPQIEETKLKSPTETIENIEKEKETDVEPSTSDSIVIDLDAAPEVCSQSNETKENTEKQVETTDAKVTADTEKDQEISAKPIEPVENEKQIKTNVNKSTSDTEKGAVNSKLIETSNYIENKLESNAKDTMAVTKLPEAEKTQEKQAESDAKPSTSDTKTSETKLTPDVEDSQEVADSLGLLAESSRVMNDDDEEEQEQEDDGDDADEDDDFDLDEEESSNHMTTGENSEESNQLHTELDIQDDGIDIEFRRDAHSMGIVTDSNDANDGFDALLRNSTEEPSDGSVAKPLESATEEKDKEQLESKDTDVDKAEKSDKSPKPKERRSSILSELLSQTDGDTDSTKADAKSPEKLKEKENSFSFVNLEGSSEDEDVQGSKEPKQAPPSVTIDSGKIVETETKVRSCSTDTGIDGAGEKESKDADKDKQKSAEIFNLDSDEEDSKKQGDKPRGNSQCINFNCTSDESVAYYLADRVTIAYYGAAKRRKRPVCQNCLSIVTARNEGLLSGIKDLRPLMSLRMSGPAQQLLEISDSDSEGEDVPVGEGLVDTQLADLFNNTWTKYNMDARLQDTEKYLASELDKMQEASAEVDKMLRDCQKATDALRVHFYSSFEPSRKDLPALCIIDIPVASYVCSETDEKPNEAIQQNMRYPKRRSTSTVDTPAKKQAVGLQSYMENDKKTSSDVDQSKQDDDKDISVVRLSAEAAPPELPPAGEPARAPLRAGAFVYAMKNQYGAWLKGRVVEILPKAENQFTQCRIKFEHKVKNPCKVLSARSLAYTEPSEVRMTIGTRVIALFQNADPANKRDSFYYSGVIAEVPNPVNSYRYLVFFDDGYVQYVHHRHTRLVYESSQLVWDEVHPYSRDFVSNYLKKYPERPMVRMHRGQSLTVEWNGKWWETSVIQVDAALVKVKFPNGRIEWIYRGSTRLQPLFTELQAARRGERARLPRSTKANTKTNMPYVEYTRNDETNKTEAQQAQTQIEELRRQRSVAKKSTCALPQPPVAASDGVVSRVVFYTPKNSIKPYKMVPHNCGPQCKRSDLLALKDLKTYNPLTKPLLSGWERQIIRRKCYREVMYRAPCGRRLRNIVELHRYLRATRSEMAVDLFDYNANTHCLAEFVLNKTNVQKKDLSHGKEAVPVPCVNYYDHSLPEFCSYNTVRTPTAGVPLNLDPEFLCGCDCDDDCVDKTKCACWKMTLEGARTIGIDGPNVGYEYRRLPEPLPSGIYECNSRCKCKQTCLNRVVQNPLQLKLQVFKTLNRGWGIRALNDVPKGAFLCIYAGNLLTDATANLDGLNEGDEYLAELDYIEVVESMKEGYEDDVPEADKILDKKESKKGESEQETESSESEEEERRDKNDMEDGDFQPVARYLGLRFTEFNKRLRRRDKNKKNKEVQENKEVKETDANKKDNEECITISDDEEVRVSQREPSRFTAQEGMTDSKVVSKYRSIRTYFGKDEACYIMDAKVQGNIGRYLNHSCSPNVFVQNVFVDTHDPRFPWVSFFALHHIRSGTELTWNYNYDIGSVPGKVLYCFCGAPNCRGRLL